MQGGLMAGDASGGTAFWGITSYTLNGTTTIVSGRLGWVFTPSGGDLACNALRVIIASSGADELVMVHRNSDSVLIAQATITPGSGNTWTQAKISPFTLQDGVAYTVSTRRMDGGTRTVRYGNTVTYVGTIGGLATNTRSSNDDNRPTGTNSLAYRLCDFGYVP